MVAGVDDSAQVILRGVAYVIETISFLMWIDLESIKFSFFGTSTALRKTNYDLADRIINTTATQGLNDLFYWIILYGIGAVPAWPAYYCFFYMGTIALWSYQSEVDIAYKMDALGFIKNRKGKWVKKYSKDDDLHERFTPNEETKIRYGL